MNVIRGEISFVPVLLDNLWNTIIETPLDDAGKAGEFIAAAALLHRTTPGEIERSVKAGLLPFLYLSIKHGGVAASPVVGALLDDLREFGGQAVNALVDRVKEVIPTDDIEGHAVYAATLSLLAQEFGGIPDAQIWISPDLYNGCEPTCKYSSQYKPDRSAEFIL